MHRDSRTGLKILWGFLLGFALGRAYEFYIPWGEPTAEQSARAYHAYRACIERSSCRMTADDWIDYYELKWELEEKEIE